jgi:ABC-2 type transport system permease protein
MPIFDQGYQNWNGPLAGHALRWLAITRQGVRVQLRKRGMKLMIVFAWVPAFLLAAVLVLWGLFEQGSSLITPFLGLFQGLPEPMRQGPRGYRPVIWTLGLQAFLGVQLFFAMLVVLRVGPDLISQDLRFGAMPLYLSRPLRRFDYFLGKLGVIVAFVSAVMIIPVLIAWLIGLSFALDGTILRDTIRPVLAALGFGALVSVSTGLLVLGLSSLSRSSRMVGAMWVALWVVSGLVSGTLKATLRQEWCPAVSYTGSLLRLRDVLLDTQPSWDRLRELQQLGQQAAVEAVTTAAIGPGLSKGLPGITKNRRGSTAANQRRPRGVRIITRGDSGDPWSMPAYPWTWAAGVVGGLALLSAGVMCTRVRSLDHLR